MINSGQYLSQETFTFSKSTLETLEKGVKYDVKGERVKSDIINVILYYHLILLIERISHLFLLFLLLTFN